MPPRKADTLPAVRVEPWVREALEEIAAARPDATLADIIREAIREYLARQP
jgi:predicted transcriptional regulator